MKERKKKLPKFERLERLVGKDKVDSLKNKCIMIVGLGGVGGYTVEALARSNIGSLILVDYDVVDETNINRQIIALESTIGKKKTDVFADRIKDINPNCKVIKIDKFIDKDNIDELFKYNIDYVVDACDTLSTKILLIEKCLKKKINSISSMGMANKMDPTKIEIVDVRKTISDPLARTIRKYVKDNNIKSKIMVVSSSEVPKKMTDSVLGSNAFVPPVAGLMIASYIINKITK